MYLLHVCINLHSIYYIIKKSIKIVFFLRNKVLNALPFLSEDGHLFRNKEALTFLINTDGASICKSSKLTLWPVYLVINELDSRFSLENVILAGDK